VRVVNFPLIFLCSGTTSIATVTVYTKYNMSQPFDSADTVAIYSTASEIALRNLWKTQ
jgi:hypothetical protein